jgi:CHASE1-domain containing sensor protein
MTHCPLSESLYRWVPWKRHLPVVMAICGGVVFSLVAFAAVRWWESRGIETAFRMAAEDRSSAVKGAFETEVAMLELICSAMTTTDRVQRDGYRELLTPFLSHAHSIQAVEWVPRVPESQRLEFETAARQDGHGGFQITELNSHGELVRASQRSEYFPVYLIGPRPGDAAVFGLDLACEPTRFDVLCRARDTGDAVASERMAFVQDTQTQFGFLVLLPVYTRGTPPRSIEDRRNRLRGFVVGVFRPGDMIEAALGQLQPEGVDVCLYDPSASADRRPFDFHASRARSHNDAATSADRLYDPKGMHHLATLDVAGHPWTIVCLPTPDFVAARRTWWSWNVLAVGLAFTGVLAAYLRLNIDRRAHAERLLAEKRRYAQEWEEKVHEQTLDIRRAEEEVIYRLVSASQWRDEETGTHIRRSGLFSEALAKAAGWGTAEAEVLRQAAPMHDVGKIGIPDAILRKPGKLTPEEFEVMKTHTVIGALILEGSSVPLLQMAREIALNHHERWDGDGYPAGLAGQNIPESARIVAIADVYDALTHDRVYRPALPRDEALTIMQQGMGTHFDPRLLAHFLAILPEIDRIARQYPDKSLGVKPARQPFAPLWPDQSPVDSVLLAVQALVAE